jgi:hypothetical protein
MSAGRNGTAGCEQVPDRAYRAWRVASRRVAFVAGGTRGRWRSWRRGSRDSPRDWGEARITRLTEGLGGTDHAARRGTGEAPRSCMPAPGASPARERPAWPASRALALFFTEKQCRCPLCRRGCVISLEGLLHMAATPAPMIPSRSASSVFLRGFTPVCHKCTLMGCMCHQRTDGDLVSRASRNVHGDDRQLSRCQDKLYASTLDGIRGGSL